jgi:hypothetical protein
MKQPVLKVKKGAVIYDDTAAQEASELPRPALPGSGPLRSRRARRRGGRLTFFPLLVIALGLFILFQIVPNTPVNRATVSGWRVTLHVAPNTDTLLVGVTFVSRAPLKEPAQGAPAGADLPEATVRFSLPGTGEQAFVAGNLVKSPMTLRGELPWLPGAKKVQAVISVGTAHVTLWQPAPGPRGVPRQD